MIKKNKLTLCLLLSAFIIFSAQAIAKDRLTITGSSTVAPLAMEIAKRFESIHPDTRIDVQTGGSSRGINDARMGLADIGMVSRALKNSENDLNAYLIALDGIGIIVHSSNPIAALTDEQIIAIYKGEIQSWKALNGKDQAITVVNKAEGRSTLELFLAYFSLKNSQIKAQVVIGDNQQGIKTVAGNPGAIAYVSVGAAEFEARYGTPIKMLSMNGLAATVDNIAKGEFALSRPLNLVVKGVPSPLVKQFIAFAQSSAVRDLITAQFFVAP